MWLFFRSRLVPVADFPTANAFRPLRLGCVSVLRVLLLAVILVHVLVLALVLLSRRRANSTRLPVEAAPAFVITKRLAQSRESLTPPFSARSKRSRTEGAAVKQSSDEPPVLPTLVLAVHALRFRQEPRVNHALRRIPLAYSNGCRCSRLLSRLSESSAVTAAPSFVAKPSLPFAAAVSRWTWQPGTILQTSKDVSELRPHEM